MKARGLGRVYQPTYKDKKTGEIKTQAVWWIQYCHHGRVIRESADKPALDLHGSERDAHKLLKRRLGEIAQGHPVGPDVEKTTFEDLAAMLGNDYKANGRQSLNRVEDSIAHLRGFFGEDRAYQITSDRVTAYIAGRQEEKAANATINRELAALKRMFTLGAIAGNVAHKPHIQALEEHNTRKGFFEPDQFQAVLSHLAHDLKPVFTTAYITGWRVHNEILTRQWHHVDFNSGWLRLEPGETKNGDGRMFPLTPELRSVLERQRELTDAIQREEERIIPWVFHREGKPIKSFRRAWITACIKAGLGQRITDVGGRLVKTVAYRIPHDFRRTAVRNLERAGIPRSAAMKMVGHKTEAIYRRYAIADEGMLKEAGEKLSAFHGAEQARFGKVISTAGKKF